MCVYRVHMHVKEVVLSMKWYECINHYIVCVMLINVSLIYCQVQHAPYGFLFHVLRLAYTVMVHILNH